MTDSEKREQRVRLGIECEQAAEDLAHERERALRLADLLNAWAQWLQELANKKPSAADFMPDLNGDDIRANPKYQECLSFTTLLQTEERLRLARQKASNLELRRMQLTSPPSSQLKID